MRLKCCSFPYISNTAEWLKRWDREKSQPTPRVSFTKLSFLLQSGLISLHFIGNFHNAFFQLSTYKTLAKDEISPFGDAWGSPWAKNAVHFCSGFHWRANNDELSFKYFVVLHQAVMNSYFSIKEQYKIKHADQAKWEYDRQRSELWNKFFLVAPKWMETSITGC